MITFDDEILAFMEMENGKKRLLGINRWYFRNKSCTDPGVDYKILSFHLDVEQPGNFCCEDGSCIDSDLVCNNFPDCDDRSDERNCGIVTLPAVGYNKNLPPLNVQYDGKKELLKINATFKFLNIFGVDVRESTFDLDFLLTLEWFEKDLKFNFLKNNSKENILTLEQVEKIWMPYIEFDHIEEIVRKYSTQGRGSIYLGKIWTYFIL